MISDEELWACAGYLRDTRGDLAPLYVEERIAAMKAEGNIAGEEAWRAILDRLNRLTIDYNVEHEPGMRLN